MATYRCEKFWRHCPSVRTQHYKKTSANGTASGEKLEKKKIQPRENDFLIDGTALLRIPAVKTEGQLLKDSLDGV